MAYHEFDGQYLETPRPLREDFTPGSSAYINFLETFRQNPRGVLDPLQLIQLNLLIFHRRNVPDLLKTSSFRALVAMMGGDGVLEYEIERDD